MLASHKCIIYLWIHVYGEVLVLYDLGISFVDLTFNPLLKNWTNDSVNHICDILPR